MNIHKLLLLCSLTLSVPAFMSAWSFRSEEGQAAEFAEDQAEIDVKKSKNKAATKKKQAKLDAEKKKANAEKKASKKVKSKKENAYKKLKEQQFQAAYTY